MSPLRNLNIGTKLLLVMLAVAIDERVIAEGTCPRGYGGKKG